jgi:hypothetical protein
MTDWRDIETAPKDGTVIDLWAQVYAHKSRDSDEMMVSVEFRVADAQWFMDGWRDIAGNSLGYDMEGLVFTHWQPLPAPPEAT